MPKEILGVEGHLQQEQPEIDSLSLNTGAPTDRNWLFHGGDYTIPPPAPRSFSWTGARLASELESLRVSLAANRSILETLELDFIDRNSVNNACQTRLQWMLCRTWSFYEIMTCSDLEAITGN